jgi:phage-related protein
MSDLLRGIRPLVFVGSSQKDLRAFPAVVRREVGQSLFEAQLGDHPQNARPLKGLGQVLEIRDSHDGDAYRAVYTTRLDSLCSACVSKEVDQWHCHAAMTHRVDQAAPA